MNILLYPLNWFASTPHTKCAGGEHYLYRICQYLLSQGHQIKCVCLTDEPYMHDGVECHGQSKMQMWQLGNNEETKWADLIITQLNGTNFAYNKAKQYDKPIMFIAHNTVRSYVIRYSQNVHVLYNSKYVHDVVNPEWQLPNMICEPPVDYRLYKRTTNGKYITLVNCNEAKGGNLFVELARLLPQYRFLGIKGGYGEQITAELPNLTYLENGADMQSVYADTAILLQPSSFETYGQAVLEAMCCGIPVIAHPTDGLVECIGGGGQFADRNNVADYVDKIVNLMNDPKEWSDKAYNRAVELDPLPRLKAVEDWMEGVIKEHDMKSKDVILK